MVKEKEAPEGYQVIFVAFITLKNGRKLYASAYGRRAWRLVVRVK